MSSNGPTLLAAPDPATTKWVPLMGLGGAPQNVTKFIDVAPTGASQAGFASNLTWSDGVDTSAYFFFEVPADYVSGSIVFRVKLAGAATGTVAWRFSRFRLRAGTAQVAVESNTNDDFTPGTTNIQVRNVVWPAGDFQAGDMLRVDLRRLGADAADTMAASVSYGGAWIEYTGSSWASAAGSADLVYNGEYPAATPYTDGDIVIYQGQAYLCVRPTSAAPVPWTVAGPRYRGYLTQAQFAALTDVADGDIVDVVITGAAFWRFRYRAGSASAYKWEFLGGSEIAVYPADNINVTAASISLANTVAIPLDGYYRYRWGGTIQNVVSATQAYDSNLFLYVGGSSLGRQAKFITVVSTVYNGASVSSIAQGAATLGQTVQAYAGVSVAISTSFTNVWFTLEPTAVKQ